MLSLFYRTIPSAVSQGVWLHLVVGNIIVLNVICV